MDREKTCCFTGHRAGKLPWGGNENDPRCEELKKRIFDAVEAVYGSGIRHYISGMALGGDTYFAEAVLRLREEHADVTLEAAIPHRDQASRWGDADRRRYESILERCDRITVLSDEYTPSCMDRRNRYMVDSSSVVIAAYNGKAGGTLNTLRYAIASELEIISLPL